MSKLADAGGIAGGESFSLAFGPPPTVTGVAPTSGAASGSTKVTIKGTDFTGATAVKFGETAASGFTVNSEGTSIAVESPAGTARAVDITVTNSWGTSATSPADRFSFTPTVTGVSPNSGPSAGGPSVTVTGSGFATGKTGTTFKFGGKKSKSVNCTSTTECTVVTPKHHARKKPVDVKATVNGLTSPKNRPGDEFTYN